MAIGGKRMDAFTIFKDIGARNNGDVYLGVVGPVRVGKSTFIKRFMEVMVLPHIPEEDQARARDELPQSGSGKTIMTVEPKFVPANGVTLPIDDSLSVKVRMIDCVGFVIDKASGYLEDGKMRMVKTPWFNETIPFDDAARIGTEKVIKEHSTLGIVVISDGTVTEFKREDYVTAEEQIIAEMNSIERPYVVVLNSTKPYESSTLALAEELKQKYGVPVIPLNAELMKEEEAITVLKEALYQFPVTSIDVALPKWVAVLDEEHPLKVSIQESIEKAMKEARIVRDVDKITQVIKENENLTSVNIANVDTGTGTILVEMQVDDSLYEKVLKDLVGCEISDKAELMAVLTEFVKAKKKYDHIASALEMAENTGYGYTNVSFDEMKIEKPSILKAGGRYGIKVKATAPTYHIVKVDLETSFEPILGSKMQSDYFVDYLSKAFEQNPLAVLDCEMFGQKFGEIMKAGVSSKLATLPEPVKIKMQQLLKTIANKGKGNLIAFVF